MLKTDYSYLKQRDVCISGSISSFFFFLFYDLIYEYLQFVGDFLHIAAIPIRFGRQIVDGLLHHLFQFWIAA